jgi:hypothetical protein
MRLASRIPLCRALHVALAVALLAAPGAVLAFPSEFPDGLTISEPSKLVPGVVMFTGADGRLYMIAPDGSVAKDWDSPVPDTNFEFVKPLLNGNLLARLRTPAGAPSAVIEMTSGGVPVWAFTSQEYRFHHDQERLPNGNTAMLCSRMLDVPAISDQTIQDDCIVEVDPAGNIVWTWQAADHFDEFGFSDDVKANIFDFGGDWAHANALEVIQPSNPHTDPRFASGNYIMSFRHINTIIVIDRATGDIAAKFQNLTVGQHNAYMIPGYLPGGGNMLVFDNGFSDPILNPGAAARNGGPARRFSRVLEFDPLTEATVWEYDASLSGRPDWWFSSPFVSGAQRLPNGSTLITEGANGRIFEVTSDGEIVWEYVSPYTRTIGGGESNLVFRAYKLVCTPSGCTPLE